MLAEDVTSFTGAALALSRTPLLWQLIKQGFVPLLCVLSALLRDGLLPTSSCLTEKLGVAGQQQWQHELSIDGLCGRVQLWQVTTPLQPAFALGSENDEAHLC